VVKRGKRLSENTTHGYEHPINRKLVQKKYSWICETCGTEYIYKSQAEECEMLHLVEKAERRDREE